MHYSIKVLSMTESTYDGLAAIAVLMKCAKRIERVGWGQRKGRQAKFAESTGYSLDVGDNGPLKKETLSESRLGLIKAGHRPRGTSWSRTQLSLKCRHACNHIEQHPMLTQRRLEAFVPGSLILLSTPTVQWLPQA